MRRPPPGKSPSDSSTRTVLYQGCYSSFAQSADQGQTHGHPAFLLTPGESSAFIAAQSSNAEVIFPYLTGDELLGTQPAKPERFVIDFQPRDVLAASRYQAPFERIKKDVLPYRQAQAKEEEERNAETLRIHPTAKVNHHHKNFLRRWWFLAYAREELITRLRKVKRYIGCSRLTKRPVFDFIDSGINPSDVVQVFLLADDYSFGVLQSDIHWAWFTARCSTLKRDPRYTSDTVFDSFPWPQSPALPQAKQVAALAVKLRELRRAVMAENEWSLRDLYRTLEMPGENPLKAAHSKLDEAVRAAYGMKPKTDPLQFLFDLNSSLAAKEVDGETIVGPGLPPSVTDPAAFITDDCVRM